MCSPSTLRVSGVFSEGPIIENVSTSTHGAALTPVLFVPPLTTPHGHELLLDALQGSVGVVMLGGTRMLVLRMQRKDEMGALLGLLLPAQSQ